MCLFHRAISSVLVALGLRDWPLPTKVPVSFVVSLLHDIDVEIAACPGDGFQSRKRRDRLVALKADIEKQAANGFWDFQIKANRIRLARIAQQSRYAIPLTPDEKPSHV